MSDPPTRNEAAADELEDDRETVLGALDRAAAASAYTGYNRVARKLRSGDLQLVPREALEER